MRHNEKDFSRNPLSAHHLRMRASKRRQILAGALALLMVIAALPMAAVASSVISISSEALPVYAKSYTVAFYEMDAGGMPRLYQEEGFANPQTVLEGERAAFPSGTPSAYTGHRFTAWNRGADQPIVASTEIYARYEASVVSTITVEFVNDRDLSMAAESRVFTVESGAPYTTSFDLPTLAGYVPVEPTAAGLTLEAREAGHVLTIAIDQVSGNYDYIVHYTPVAVTRDPAASNSDETGAEQVPYRVVHRFRVNGSVVNEDNILDKTEYGALGSEITVQAAELDGYLPDRREKTIQLDSRAGATVTFYYEPIAEVQGIEYTVYYRDAQNPMEDVVPADTFVAHEETVVVARRAVAPGYTPDAYEKELQLSLNDPNEVTFLYKKNADADAQVPYTITTYVENPVGDGYVIKSVVDAAAPEGTEVTAEPETIDGFTYNEALSLPSGVVLSDGSLNLCLYYQLPRTSYTVSYLELNTNEPVAEPATRTDVKLGSRVEEKAPEIEGYTFVSHSIGDIMGGGETLNVQIDEDGIAITFFYTKGESPDDGDEEPGATEHTIIATTTTGGTVSPQGEMKVPTGGSQRYAFGSASGYQIARIVVDGEAVYTRENATDRDPVAFVFNNVTVDHTLDVIYAAIEGSGQPDVDPEARDYTLRVRHVMQDTQEQVAPEQTQLLAAGAQFTYTAVQAEGRKATHAAVTTADGSVNITDGPANGTGKMPRNDMSVTVYYVSTSTASPTEEVSGEAGGEENTGGSGGGRSGGGGGRSSGGGSAGGSEDATGGVSVDMNQEIAGSVSVGAGEGETPLSEEETLEPMYVMLDNDIPLGGVAARNTGECFE